MKKCEDTVCLCKNCIINACERFDCQECKEKEFKDRKVILNCNNFTDKWI